jgi:hypothetical protein
MQIGVSSYLVAAGLNGQRSLEPEAAAKSRDAQCRPAGDLGTMDEHLGWGSGMAPDHNPRVHNASAGSNQLRHYASPCCRPIPWSVSIARYATLTVQIKAPVG